MEVLGTGAWEALSRRDAWEALGRPGDPKRL